MVKKDLKSKFVGSIIGGAIGDALGMPVESIQPDDRIRQYKDITTFLHPYSNSRAEKLGLKKGQYTDDTQLTIETIYSIIKKECVDFADIASHFRRIYQNGELRLAGRTTQLALKNLSKGINWKDAGIKNGAGNGPALRIAPVALYSLYALPNELLDYIFDTPSITHVDPKAIDGSLVILYSIRTFVQEQDYFLRKNNDDFLNGLSALCYEDSGEDTMKKRLIDLKEIITLDESIAFTHLKTTGYILDTVQTALYCFFKHKNNFEKAVLTAVNNSYDADSIAGLTGYISGAYLGIEEIPLRLKINIENHHHLTDIAEKLYQITIQGMEDISIQFHK